MVAAVVVHLNKPTARVLLHSACTQRLCVQRRLSLPQRLLVSETDRGTEGESTEPQTTATTLTFRCPRGRGGACACASEGKILTSFVGVGVVEAFGTLARVGDVVPVKQYNSLLLETSTSFHCGGKHVGAPANIFK